MKPQRFRSVFRTFLLAAALALPSAAQAQNELNTPYNLHIVVHVAQNRLLTDVFRDRIERELHDGFQAGLGDMGRVTVTHEHPRLADVLARGLKQSLDGWKDREDVKTHFVLIDYSGAHYEIRARQYDGTVGVASRVVRRDRTRDRDFVAKAAALLIKQDFGILGTVRTEPEGPKEQVKIELRGGGLGDMTRWVNKDDVFALVPPGGGTSAALNWSLLQIEQAPAEDARDGVCVCRFFHRYRVPSIAGYYCIKLGTVQTALRLRWIQKTPGSLKSKPLDKRLTVDIRRHGFDGEEATRLQKPTDLNGGLETVNDGKDGVFANVAFVCVSEGMNDPKPQVPIALVDDQPLFIDVNISGEFDTLFTVRKSSWQNNVADSLQMQANLFKRLETLGSKADQHQEAIREAESGLKRSRDDRANLLKEKEGLVKEAREKNKELNTSREDKRLQRLANGEKVLSNFIDEQKKIEATENDPKLKKWLSEIQNAKLLENDLEFDKALAIYQRIQKEGYQNAEFDAYVKEVQKLWKVAADREHDEARRFIYRVWPTLDTARLEDKIDDAEKALKKCKEVSDVITIQKMLKGTEGHADRLRKELEELLPEWQIDDKKQELQLKKVSERLLKLGEEMQDYLKAHAPDS